MTSRVDGQVDAQLTIDDFDAWVAPHLRSMGLLAARLTSPDERDDVVQDALARAWSRRSTYDPARGTPAAWLLAITADQARRTRTRRRMRVGHREGPSRMLTATLIWRSPSRASRTVSASRWTASTS